MKRIGLVVILLGCWSGPGLAQTTDELVNDGKNTDNVTTQSMGYDRKSYSPLKQINKSNVKRLVPIWSTSLMNDLGELAAPTVYNGVMYVDQRQVDVRHRRRDRPADLAHAGRSSSRASRARRSHRGAATIYNGKLFRVTIDNHLLALDMKTGKQLWNQKFADAKEGYYATGAPIVANGVLISGMAGGESTTRGFLDGWDPDTGKKLWRRYTIPAPGEPGSETWPKNSDAWKHGGGPTWRSGSYDPAARSRLLGHRQRGAVRSAGRARRWTACTRRACSRSVRRPARSPATTSTRPTTCTTWTAPTSTCSPISRSAASCAR